MLGHCVCARTWICTVYSCTPRHTQCCGRGHAAGNLHSTYYIYNHTYTCTHTQMHTSRAQHIHTHTLWHTHIDKRPRTHVQSLSFPCACERVCVRACTRAHTLTQAYVHMELRCGIRCLALGLWCVIEMGQEGRRGGSGAHFSTTAKVVVEFTCFSPL
jgi:hypothetical protein